MVVKSLRRQKKKKKKKPSLLTQRRFVQEVQLCVEGPDLGIFLLDDADDEVQQRLLPVRRFGVQQLRRANRKQSETNAAMTSEALQRKH